MLWNAKQQPPWELMSFIVTAWCISQVLRNMAAFNLADRLADGPRTAAALASVTGTFEPTPRSFRQTLAGPGLCATVDDGSLRLTEPGEPLQSDIPASMRPYALAMAAQYLMRAWEELRRAIQTGLIGLSVTTLACREWWSPCDQGATRYYLSGT